MIFARDAGFRGWRAGNGENADSEGLKKWVRPDGALWTSFCVCSMTLYRLAIDHSILGVQLYNVAGARWLGVVSPVAEWPGGGNAAVGGLLGCAQG
jgi:hypothetical protein